MGSHESNTLRDLRGIHSVANGSKIWAVGEDGTIVHSNDGGEKWNAQQSNTSLYLYSVHSAADGLRVWAVGEDGTIVHSADGGETWSLQDSQTGIDLDEVTGGEDGRPVLAVGDNGTLLYSVDEGANWNVMPAGEEDLLGVYVSPDGSTAWAFSSQGLIQSHRLGVYPVVEAARVGFDLNGDMQIEIMFLEGDYQIDPDNVVLMGGNAYTVAQFGYSEIDADAVSYIGRNMIYSFDPSEQLNARPPETIRLAISMTTDGFTQRFPIADVEYRRFVGLTHAAIAFVRGTGLVIVFGLFFVGSGFVLLANSRKRGRRARDESKSLEIERAMRLLFPAEDSVVRPAYYVTHRHSRAKNRTGDFYNWFHRRDGSLSIYCVDVEGHGELAADTAQAVSQLVDQLNDDLYDQVWASRSPQALLEEIDKRAAATRRLERGSRSFTMSITEIDPGNSRIRHANAGMPSPLLFRVAESGPRVLRAVGVYLGRGYGENPVEPRQDEVTIGPGDLLVIASDGILEARDRQGRLFGYHGLERTVTTYRDDSPDGVADAIFTAVEAHTNFGNHARRDELDDDRTLVMVKVMDTRREFTFGLLSAPDFARVAELVLKPQFKAFANQNGFCGDRFHDVWIALSEAIQNAILYGSDPDDIVTVRSSTAAEVLKLDVHQPRTWNHWEDILGEARQREIKARGEGPGGTSQMILCSDAITVTTIATRNRPGSCISMRFT